MTRLQKADYAVTPAIPALEETYDATVSASTEITLNTATTIVEVCATDKGIFMKYGTADVASTDFDEFIPANTCKILKIPIDPTTGLKYTALNFIEEAATAHLIVIEK